MREELNGRGHKLETEIESQRKIYLNFMANLWVSKLGRRTPSRLPKFESGIGSSSRSPGRRVVDPEEPKRVERKDNRVE